MSKFKVGDKVKIREDLIWDHYYGDIRCSSKRLECRGKIGEITKIAKTGSYFVHNHWFSEEMLEAYDSKNTSKFKIGDKVRIVGKNSECLDGFDIGDICEIIEIDEDDEYDPYHILKLYAEERLHGWAGEDDIESLPTLEYIDDYMDTSNRPVVDLSDRSDDSIDAFRYFVESGLKPLDIHGIKEEKDMNKVVDLWYKRKKENIYKKYKDLEDTYVKEHYEIVKQYNELIEDFEKNLEDFCTEYSDITVNEDFVICKNADCNVYKYVIDEGVIRNDARIAYKEDKNEEYKELQLKYEDLNALLSMSDDLEYQQSILIEYGIINKKTKRIINENNIN